MYHRRSVRNIGGDRGQALVEMAMVLPVFLILVFGMIDFGQAINYWLDQNHLASSGAPLALANYQPDSGTLQHHIRSQADTAELRDGATVDINYPAGRCNVGDPIEIVVVYRYTWLSFLGRIPTAPQTDIIGKATMRLEQKPTFAGSGCGA